MNNRRRATLIIISVISGTLLSGWLLLSKRGTLDNHDYFLLATNLVISLILIFGIGYIMIWKKKD
jgi:uncharacterized membrane protein YozB (DUF420 family)